jgi:plastocyanin
MKIQTHFRICGTPLLFPCVVLLICTTAHAQKKNKYVCDEAQPASLCTAANTCGSASASCTIDITKSGNFSNVKPGISNAKNNQFFCIQAGTTVVWKTSNKHTGFVIFFGTDSPFDPDDPIIGGANKQVTVKANAPGCYKYDAGAFFSGATYGMSGGSKRELVILP